MHLIKLDATESTNDYLKQLASHKVLTDFTVVMAKNQYKGKGQMGSTWQSKEGKNLTFSVLKMDLHMNPDDGFLLNIIVSLAVRSVLDSIGVPDLKIKWPNDILSGNQKICGILIESQLSANHLKSAILGIGLNVNQIDFHSLKNASSLKLLLRRDFDLNELLFSIIHALKRYFEIYNSEGETQLKDEYGDNLFRRNKPSTFERVDNSRFMGFIRGVSSQGKLIVELEDQIIKKFGLKEIKLLY